MPNDTEEKSALHESIVINGASLTAFRGEIVNEFDKLKDSIEQNGQANRKTAEKIVSMIIKAPFSLICIGTSYYFLWHGKIEENRWFWLILIFISPFYSEGLELIFKIWRSKNGK